MSNDLLEEWNSIVESLSRISSLKICRFVGTVNEGTKQLLAFCDASMRAYATVYLRTDDGNLCQINLLFSKVRLVPVGRGKNKKHGKHLTIP